MGNQIIWPNPGGYIFEPLIDLKFKAWSKTSYLHNSNSQHLVRAKFDGRKNVVGKNSMFFGKKIFSIFFKINY
jgi:hypothetical protein